MRLGIISVIILALTAFGVYHVMKGSPKPNKSEIAYAYERLIKTPAIKWTYEFGDETRTAEGTPAWPVIYRLTLSGEGMQTREETITLLFWKDGLEWRTKRM